MAFAGGGALGLMLSPTPWYMMRDMAFWTQNWPWVPVPEPGKPSFARAVCTMCGGSCGIRTRLIGPRLVEVKGDADHPVNKGSVCPQSTAALQMLYGPARIAGPLKRAGDRKDPRWQPISWDEAFSEVVSRITDLRSSGVPQRLACITNSHESTVNQLLERFLQATGSPNFMKMPSATDSQRIVAGIMQGLPEGPAYDIENARLILSFGCNLFDGWGSAGRMYRAHAEWFADPDNPGAQIVQIEPNLSPTSAKSADWVQLEPGTEAALALGMAHVLIKKDLYDKAFVEQHCFGFDDWEDAEGRKHTGFKTEVLGRYSPRIVESITHVPAKKIEDLAVKFAANRPSLALGGRGAGDLYSDLYELMAIQSLNALMGNMCQKGGILPTPTVPLKAMPPVKMDDIAERGYEMARSDEAGSDKYPFTRYLPGNLDVNSIDFLIIHEANPYYALPEQRAAEGMFDKIPYVVSLSPYLDESAAAADLVLPVPTPFERWDDQIGLAGLQYAVYNLNRPLVPPVHDTVNAGDILIELAHRMGGAIAESFPWENFADVLRERAEGLYESKKGLISVPEPIAHKTEDQASGRRTPARHVSFPSFWEDLVTNCCWYDPEYRHGNPAETLKTSGHRFEFFSRRLKSAFRFSEDIRCMPHYSDPAVGPEGLDLTVMPENLIAVADNGMGTPPLLIKQLDDEILRKDDIFVQINPITAKSLAVKEGDNVVLETPTGKAGVRIHISGGVRDGVVLIPLGFGHTAYDKFLRNKGVNAHRVLEARKDSISGLPLWWATPGKILRA